MKILCRENHWVVKNGQLYLRTKTGRDVKASRSLVDTLDAQIRRQVYAEICAVPLLDNRKLLMRHNLERSLLAVQDICARVALKNIPLVEPDLPRFERLREKLFVRKDRSKENTNAVAKKIADANMSDASFDFRVSSPSPSTDASQAITLVSSSPEDKRIGEAVSEAVRAQSVEPQEVRTRRVRMFGKPVGTRKSLELQSEESEQ